MLCDGKSSVEWWSAFGTESNRNQQQQQQNSHSLFIAMKQHNFLIARFIRIKPNVNLFTLLENFHKWIENYCVKIYV